MSFSRNVKNELVKKEYESSCCERAFLYGMCIFGKGFSRYGVGIQTENRDIAELFSRLIARHCRVSCDVKASPSGKSFSVILDDSSDCDKILGTFAHDGTGSLRINHSNFICEACVRAFLAGAFLSCGTISSPEKDYHLEFTIPYLNLSRSLVTLLNELDLSPKYANRKGYNIVYFKESEAIEDCLYIMGASSAMFEMMNIEIVKDIRNKANRTANCETANIEKTVRASYEHISAIEKIEELKGLDYLGDDLRKVAELRIDNPEASLSDLAQMSGMSRSGVNYKLKRIVAIAGEL